MNTPLRPVTLTPASLAIWDELTERHQFEPHELVTFERALRWFDRSDQSLASADAAVDGRERAQLMKQAMDGANCGLRYWRALKFTDGTTARRPGRPSGDDWSAKRKLQKVG